MTNYFKGKLAEINYRMAIHEGDANSRLASEAVKILVQLAPYQEELPNMYIKQFKDLVEKLEATIESLPEPGLTPVKVKGIRNSTATRYIGLLLDIQAGLED